MAEQVLDRKGLFARQSDLVKAMRFPLIVVVVICHALIYSAHPMQPTATGEYAFYFFSELISHNFGKIAVCWFFVFSGYFFFFNMKEELLWTKDGFAYKWKKRIRTLLVPYLAWNLIAVAAVAIKVFICNKLGVANDEGELFSVKAGPLFWFITGPANFPLWYMRDLLILSVLAPVIYYFFKYLKIWGLVLLTLVYLSPWNPNMPGMRAIFFFGLGAYLGIFKINMLEICRKVKVPALILCIVLVIIATFLNFSKWHELALRVFYPFGMITFMNICDGLIDNEARKNRLIGLASYVFFIYAAHEVYILGWTKGLIIRLIGDSLLAQFIGYLIVPVIVLAVCMILYRILNKIMPKALAFISGGSSK